MEELAYSCPTYGNKISENCINNECVCPTCLSRHRSLHPLNEHQRDLMVVLGIFKIQNIQKICWECYAMIKNVIRFKQTAIQAQQLLLNRDLVVLNEFGNLSKLRKTDYINVLSISEKDDEIRQTIDYNTMKPDCLPIKLKIEEPIITTVKHIQNTAQVQETSEPVTIIEKRPILLDPDHPDLELDHYGNQVNQPHNNNSTNDESLLTTELENRSVTTLGNVDKMVQNTSQSTFNNSNTSKVVSSSVQDYSINPQSVLTSDDLLKTFNTSLKKLNSYKIADTFEDFGVKIRNATANDTSNITTFNSIGSLPNVINTHKATESPLADTSVISQNLATADISEVITQEVINSSFNDVIYSTEVDSFEDLSKITDNVNMERIIDSISLQIPEVLILDENVLKSDETLLTDSSAVTQNAIEIKRSNIKSQEILLDDVNVSKLPEEIERSDITTQESIRNVTNISKAPLDDSVTNSQSATAIETLNIINQTIMLNNIDISKEPKPLMKNSAATAQTKINMENPNTVTHKPALNDINTSKVFENPLRDSVILTNGITGQKSFICDELSSTVYHVNNPSETNSDMCELEHNFDTEELNHCLEEINDNNEIELEQKQSDEKPQTVIQKLGKIANNLICDYNNISTGFANIKCTENDLNAIVEQQIKNGNKTNIRISKSDYMTKFKIKNKTIAKSSNESYSSDLNHHSKRINKRQQLVVSRVTADSSQQLILHDIQAMLTEHDRKTQQTYSSFLTDNHRNRHVTTTKRATNTIATLFFLKSALLDHCYCKNSLSLYKSICTELYNLNNTIQIQNSINSNDKQNAITVTGMSNQPLEIGEVDNWENEFQDASIHDTRNEQIKNKTNLLQKDVSSIGISPSQPTEGITAHKKVDLKNKENTGNNNYNTLLTDIKVEKCYPEYVEENTEINHNLEATKDMCKIEQEEVHIKPEPCSYDTESNATKTTLETEMRSETDNLETLHCETDLNYYSVPATDPTKLSYYDYNYKPLDHSEGDHRNSQNEYNTANNAKKISNDFEMSNITVWFSSFQPNTDIVIEPATETTENDQSSNLNSIPSTNNSENNQNRTQDLLEPVYYTSWTDQTFEHISKEVNNTSKNTRKRVSFQEKVEVKYIKIEKDEPEVKTRRLSERIKNKKLDLIRKNKSCVECECNKNKLRNKPNKLNKNTTHNDKTILQGMNSEKLYIQPTVLLTKIDPALNNQHDINMPVIKIKDEPPEELEEITVTPEQVNVKNEIDKELTSDLVQDPITKSVVDQLLAINKTNERTPTVHHNAPVKPIKRIRRKREETALYTLRALENGEFETLKAKILDSAKFLFADFKCFTCLRKFSDRGCFQNHLKCHRVTAGSEVCVTCDRRFKDKLKLKIHASIHKRCVQCLWCPEEYLIVEDYREHIYKMHPAEVAARNQRLYTCDICHKTHSSHKSLRDHKVNHHFVTTLSLTENNSSLTRNNSSLTENLSSLTGNDSILTGNDLSLTGNDSSLTGNDSSLTGNYSILTGNDSSLTGNDSSLTGKYSNLTRNHSSLTGSDSSKTGNYSSLTGNDSSLTGNDSSLIGNDSSLSRNFMTARNNSELTGNLSSVTVNNLSFTENCAGLTGNNSSITQDFLFVRKNRKKTCPICYKKLPTVYGCRRHLRMVHSRTSI